MMGLNSTNSSKTDTDDDELTNLQWLQDNNLLQNMNQDNESSSSDCSLKGFKEDNENVSPKKAADRKEIDNRKVPSSTICTVPPVRYNPLLHTHTKPPYSF